MWWDDMGWQESVRLCNFALSLNSDHLVVSICVRFHPQRRPLRLGIPVSLCSQSYQQLSTWPFVIMCLSLSGGKKIPGNVQLQPGNPLSPIGPGPSILKHPVEHSPSSINLSLQAKREKLERLYKDVLHLKIRKRQRVWWLGWRYNHSQGTLMGLKTSQNWLPGITRRHFSGCVLVLGGVIESFPDFQSMWRLESIVP